MMSLTQICMAVNGGLTGSDLVVQDVSINSREDCRQKLFVALKGDRFDAHEFVVIY